MQNTLEARLLDDIATCEQWTEKNGPNEEIFRMLQFYRLLLEKLRERDNLIVLCRRLIAHCDSTLARHDALNYLNSIGAGANVVRSEPAKIDHGLFDACDAVLSELLEARRQLARLAKGGAA